MQTFSYKNWENMTIALAGSYQIKNAALAWREWRPCGSWASRSPTTRCGTGCCAPPGGAASHTCATTPWSSSMGPQPRRCPELKQSLELYFPGKKLYFVMGMFKDRTMTGHRHDGPPGPHIITVETPNNPAPCPPKSWRRRGQGEPRWRPPTASPRRWKSPGHGRERGRDHHLRLSVLPGRGR